MEIWRDKKVYRQSYARGTPQTPLETLVGKMPVKIILNSEAGLLGAAVFAAGQR